MTTNWLLALTWYKYLELLGERLSFKINYLSFDGGKSVSAAEIQVQMHKCMNKKGYYLHNEHMIPKCVVFFNSKHIMYTPKNSKYKMYCMTKDIHIKWDDKGVKIEGSLNKKLMKCKSSTWGN